ncbi:MAG: hypothetical protein J6C29_02265 [Clostridia bacterium]|nr:hypothetical protein [Clostridia bacterium]
MVKKAITIMIVLCMIFTFSACSSEEDKEEILITSQNSPDGNYSVYLYQVGSPQWSFGSVGAKLILKNSNDKVVDEKEFSLANDGAGVYEGNLKSITWLENEVKILIDADEAPEEYYILNYSE